MEDFLYRGVNIETHNKREGLTPKGSDLAIEAQYGDCYAIYGNGIEFGKALSNGINSHQKDSAKVFFTNKIVAYR